MLKKELSIFTFGDLLLHFPYRYIDRSLMHSVMEIHAEMPYVQLKGKISQLKEVGVGRGSRLTARFTDSTGSIQLIWFKGTKWVKDKLRNGGHDWVVFGKPAIYNGAYNIAHPELEDLASFNSNVSTVLQPVYHTSEKMKSVGLDSRGLAKIMKILVSNVIENIHEVLPNYLVENLNLLSRKKSLLEIHFPKNRLELRKAESRLSFEELFFAQFRIVRQRVLRQNEIVGFNFSHVGNFFNTFFYGKTLVALMTMLIAIDNGYQVAMMAPTEILAKQHLATIQKFLKEMNLEVGLLTGSSKTKERRILHEKLQNGELNILIGTHALIEDSVKFKNLGFVVIDEQHRFGVAQRAKLWGKNIQPPHILVMTATPIPRTLSMTLYGDLDVSVIDELPPGRKAIQTYHFFDSKRLSLFRFMHEQIKAGRQVYVVYPLIEESEKLDLKDLTDGYESMVREFPLPDYRVSIVHGKMKPDAKEFEMNNFASGKTQILVATTVIEVGVDVPNATIMIIENAERFGLSQLHQLRGRVGRGGNQSYCMLMSSYKLSTEAKERLATMVRTNDGFEIAEADLRLRGAGDIHGTRQSGMLDLKIADIIRDEKILKIARQKAIELCESDPKLENSENNPVKIHLKAIEKKSGNWGLIS